MKDYIIEHRLLVLTTILYWPWLNPTEKSYDELKRMFINIQAKEGKNFA